jgi:putative cardiolipin synthase
MAHREDRVRRTGVAGFLKEAPRRRRWLVLALRAVGALVVIAIGVRLFESRHERADGLAPFRAGMSLRQTFETLPDPGREEAALRLVSDNTEAWVERWRLLESAKKSIDVSYFILHEDVFGLSFLGHLLERARAGVRIRILFDGFGTTISREIMGNAFLEELAAEKTVKVRTYRPLWRRWTEALLTLRPSALIASEHDKIIVVDGRRSLIGGRNIAVEYFSDPVRVRDAFKDLDVRIDSEPIGSALTRAFESQLDEETDMAPAMLGTDRRDAMLLGVYRAMGDWLHGRPVDPAGIDPGLLGQLESNPKLKGRLRDAAPSPVRADTRIVDSRPRFGEPDDAITKALQRFARAAKKTIFVQTPYVVLSEEGVAVLEDAARRGVEITILTNSPVSSDNALSQAFFLEQWPTILARVPTLRLFVAGQENNLHAKAVTFDGQVALVGTYNLDPMSMAFNSEVMAASWSSEVARLTDRAARRAIEKGAPEVFEYRIARSADGRARLDEDGAPVIEFGPTDHCTPEEWTALAALWGVLRASEDYIGFSPLL